jgi:hypothetical protein
MPLLYHRLERIFHPKLVDSFLLSSILQRKSIEWLTNIISPSQNGAKIKGKSIHFSRTHIAMAH